MTTTKVEFRLRITLGNEAMRERSDVAAALRKVADRLEVGLNDMPIRDANGNIVGEWTVNWPTEEVETSRS